MTGAQRPWQNLSRPSSPSAPLLPHAGAGSHSPTRRPMVEQPRTTAANVHNRQGPRRFTPGAFSANNTGTATAAANVAASYRDASSGDMSGSISSHSNGSVSGEKFGFSSGDPRNWISRAGQAEPDDWLHEPDRTNGGAFRDSTGTIFTLRGLMNVGSLALLALGLIMLFGGYPVLDVLLKDPESTKGGFNLGGTNGTGQMFAGMRPLVDPDTPISARTRLNVDGRTNMKLVFSDEFNTDGRSFYPGDDPYWTGVDLHYWGTGDLEWYDPAAITTSGGNLVITLEEMANHNLNFRSGMLQSWNKFCFTGGLIEVRVLLPGSHDISGLWPGAWTMGNLGRAGYGATNYGTWPYSYDTCDVGTLPNQTYPASRGGGPIAAETSGVFVDAYGPGVSYLPGQKLSACTCPGEDHPGPRRSDGSYAGRSAPEIDILEAAAGTAPGRKGHVSMSLQMAPFNAAYKLPTTPGATVFYDDRAKLNTYEGAVYQQAISGLVDTNDNNYEDTGAVFSTYAFSYEPGKSRDSHVTWLLDDNPMWRVNSAALAPDPRTELSQRPVPTEPMYIILNLGMSESFTRMDWQNLKFPARYLIDYVRVWQDEGKENVGCDPPSHPTADYIKKHEEAYNNINLTTWTEPRSRGGYAQRMPRNRLMGEC